MHRAPQSITPPSCLTPFTSSACSGLQCGLLIGQRPLPRLLKGCHGQQEPASSKYIWHIILVQCPHTISIRKCDGPKYNSALELVPFQYCECSRGPFCYGGQSKGQKIKHIQRKLKKIKDMGRSGINTHTCKRICTRMHAHKHKHTNTHTHTHAHTHHPSCRRDC